MRPHTVVSGKYKRKEYVYSLPIGILGKIRHWKHTRLLVKLLLLS